MKTIGLILPTTDNSFFADLANELSIRAMELGYELLIASTNNSAEKEREQLKLFESYGLDGILCVTGLSKFTDDLVAKNIPIVFIDRVPDADHPIPWVANDDQMALYEATSYLVENGCRNILLAPGFVAEGNDSPRIKGYELALKDHELTCYPDYILKRAGKAPSEVETKALVMDHLRKGSPVDGIITSSDRAAFGAMAALESVGFYVPEDVKLITFDNSPYAAASVPAVTALDRNTDQMAERALELLQALMQGKPCEMENIIPVSLVRRESTR